MGKKYILLHYLLFVFSINSAIIYAQELSDNDRYDFLDAEYYYSIQDFGQAIKLYLKIIKRHPENANINYVTGRCYLSMPGEEGNALLYLEKAVTKIDEKYSPGSSKNVGSPPEAWLYYGDALHRNNELEKASFAYHKYKSYVENNNAALEMINQRIRGLGISYEASLRPPHISITNIGEPVNTENSEYNPLFTANDETMIYTSYKDQKDKVYLTNQTNGSWEEPHDITGQLGSKGEFFTAAISSDGKTLYCINYDQRNSDVFMSEYSGGKWSKLQPLEGRLNSSFHETSIFVSGDGNTAYFSSDRSGGYGGFDLYYSVLDGGSWSKPVNMGSIINTKGDETSPRMSSDGKTLFFSSDGFETIGKKDIHYSLKDQDGNWGIPVNMGYPYNTVDDDEGFFFSDDQKTLYIARVLSDGMGKKDIIAIHDLGKIIEPEPEPIAEIVPEPEYRKEKTDSDTVLAEPVDSVSLELVSTANSEANSVEEPEYTETGSFEEVTETIEAIVPESQKTDYSFTNSDTVFTIQLMALIFPKESTNFMQIDKNKIKSTLGVDGYTRYTYSEYISFEEAQTDLKTIIHSGFRDAFIRKISEISNY